jgi:hypothetical protein
MVDIELGWDRAFSAPDVIDFSLLVILLNDGILDEELIGNTLILN